LHTPLSAVVAAAECVRLLCAAAGDWVRRFRVGGLVSVWFTRQVVKTEALGACCTCSSESYILILICFSDMKAARAVRAAFRIATLGRVPQFRVGGLVRLLCAAAGDWARRVIAWFTRQVVKTEALSVIAAASRLHRSISPADAAHVDKCALPTQGRP
jgi:hypothetical protein